MKNKTTAFAGHYLRKEVFTEAELFGDWAINVDKSILGLIDITNKDVEASMWVYSF